MIKKFNKYFESNKTLDFGEHKKSIEISIVSTDIKYFLDLICDEYFEELEYNDLYNYYFKNKDFQDSVKEFVLDLYHNFLLEGESRRFPEDWIFIFAEDIKDFFEKNEKYMKDLKKLKELKDLGI